MKLMLLRFPILNTILNSVAVQFLPYVNQQKDTERKNEQNIWIWSMLVRHKSMNLNAFDFYQHISKDWLLSQSLITCRSKTHTHKRLVELIQKRLTYCFFTIHYNNANRVQISQWLLTSDLSYCKHIESFWQERFP